MAIYVNYVIDKHQKNATHACIWWSYYYIRFN